LLASVSMHIPKLAHRGVGVNRKPALNLAGYPIAGLNVTVPLYFELTLETIFGFGDELAASTVLIVCNTIVQIIFLGVPTEIDGSAFWMNCVVCGVVGITLLPMGIFKAKYLRLAVDTDGQEDPARGFDRVGCL